MTEGISESSRPRRPESVSPIVAYVAHEDCSVTGNVYYVADGGAPGIFVAETQGVVFQTSAPQPFTTA